MKIKRVILPTLCLIFAPFLVAQNAENLQTPNPQTAENLQTERNTTNAQNSQNATAQNETNSQNLQNPQTAQAPKNSQKFPPNQAKNSQNLRQNEAKNAQNPQIQFSKICDFESYFKALQSDFEVEKLYNPFFDQTDELNLQAIAGKRAKINEQWYEKGDVVQGFVVREVSASRSQISLENPAQAHSAPTTLRLKPKSHKIKIKEHKN